MRQGQQNRRGRGRNNNHNQNHHNRKPQNLLSKNYESSGPDVKIRGTAQHIAEKYQHLARDASASGDFITAENYLQHAEHYNRIIMAAQAAAASQQQSSYQPQNSPQPVIAENGNANGNGHQPQGQQAPEASQERVFDDVQTQHDSAEGEDTAANLLPDFLTQPVPTPESTVPTQRERAPREGGNGGRNRRRRRPVNGGAEGRNHADASNGATGHVNGKDPGAAAGSDADFPPDEMLS